MSGVKVKMNKNQKILLALTAIAVPLILISASYPILATPDDTNEPITINFTVYPENSRIVVERGETVTVPLKVEAPRDAEMTLQVQVVSFGQDDPAALWAAVSEPTLVLSKQDAGVEHVGTVSSVRDAGMLTLAVPPTVSPGTYTFVIEAAKKADARLAGMADELVSGTIVTVEVK